MSSFFPPGFGTSAVPGCKPGHTQRYEIFCSTVLSAKELFGTWYQAVNLAIGASAIFIPLLFFLAYTLFKPKESTATPVKPKPKSESPT